MKKMMMAVVACCAMISTVLTACNNAEKPVASVEQTELLIDLDSIMIVPYMAFGASLDEVEKHMEMVHDDYKVEQTDSLVCYEEEGTTTYGRCYERGNRQIRFGFDDAEGSSLAYTSYDYFFPVRLESIMTELEKKGFEDKGEVKFDDDNADICYLFLSADEKTEVLLSKCERNGGSWAICFQPTDINDLNHIVTRHEVILFINNIKKTVLL